MEAINPALDLEYQRRRVKLQERRYSAFNPRTLAWLALPPGWTVELAKACRFPVPSSSLEDFIQKAQSAGLVKAEFDGDQITNFWMPPGERSSLLEWLNQRWERDSLLKTTWEIGRAIQRYLPGDKDAAPLGAMKQVTEAVRSFTSTPIQVPENIARWATLAAMIVKPDELTAWIDERVMDLLDQDGSGEAIAWLEVARSLASLGGETLERAVIQGTHRLQLVYRRSMEARLLKSFLWRPEQMEPFYDLLSNEGNVWALHYLGMGGVGKTMLLRYISAGCPDPEQKHPKVPRPYLSCRVDFDYIEPQFPFKKPGQLLLDLAAELRLQGVRSDILRQFNVEVDNLHLMMLSRESGFDLARLMESDEQLNAQFRKMLTTFYQLIQEVYQEKEGALVILVLDTCEELAKIPAPQGQLLAVEATFYILETLRAIHEERFQGRPLPFRVIFSGRRVLAQRGPGWHLKEGQAGGKRELLPPEKTYLAMHELRGFDYPDLKRFLCEKKPIPAVSFSTYRAILRNSPEMGRSADVVFDRPSYREGRLRYNPFDANLFADWLLDSPETSAQEIAGSIDDPYIEFRILKRLRSQTLASLLPHLVMLERADESLLRSLFKALGEENYDEAFRELGDQEWIDYIPTKEQRVAVLGIDSNFLPRLQRYYGLESFARQAVKAFRRQEIPKERQEQVQAAKDLLAPLLKGIILGKDEQESYRLDQLDPSCLDTALRLLPPEEAAQVWESVDRRVPSELDWRTAIQYMNGVLASESGETRDHPIWAGVQAMQAAIDLHANPDSERSGRWQAVQESAGRYPEGPGRERLLLRAELGAYAEARLSPDGSLPKDWKLAEVLETILSIWEALPEPGSLPAGLPVEDQQMAASAAAALENVVELIQYGQIQGKYPPMMLETARLQALESRLAASLLHTDLSAFARSLVGKLLLLKGERELAWQVMSQAARPWLEDPPASREIWQDWRPPESLSSRLRLEALRALPVVLSPADEDDLGTWRYNAIPSKKPWNADRERLASAGLLEELKRRPVKQETIKEIRAGWDGAAYPSECFAHEQTPHLRLALGRAYLALGLGKEAIDLLSEMMDSATDEASREAARLGLLECLRRLRRYSNYTWIKVWMESERFEQVALAWPAEYLNGHQNPLLTRGQVRFRIPETPTPQWQHLMNQLRRTPKDLEPERASQPVLPEASYAQFALEMDLIEKSPPGGGPVVLDFQDWLRLHPGQEENALRLALQADYLVNLPVLPSLNLRTDQLADIVRSQRSADARSILTDLRSPVEAHQSPEYFAPSLPARRRGEIALEEGELLALRSPNGGRAILKLAQSWFEEAGDSFGALQAALCAGMALVRKDPKDPALAEELEKSIRPAYEACRAANPDLPERQALLEKSATGLAAFEEAIAPVQYWRAWLGYLLVLEWSALPNWEALVQAIQDPRSPTNPPEIDFIKKKASDDNVPGWAIACGGIFVIALLGLVGYVFYLVYKGFEAGLNKSVLFQGIPTGWKVVIFILGAGLISTAVYMLVQWINGIGRLAWKGSGPEDHPAFSLTRQYARLKLGWLDLGRKDKSWHWEGKGVFKVPPEDNPPPGFLQAVEHLQGLVSNSTVKRLPLSVEASSSTLQASPLEQTWALRLDAYEPERVLQRLGMYRTTPGSSENELWAATGWRMGLVRVVCSASTENEIHSAWKGYASGVAFGTPPSSPMAGIPKVPFDGQEITNKKVDQAQQNLLEHLLNKELSQEERNQVLSEKDRSMGQILQRICLARPDLQLPCRVLHLVGTPAPGTAGLAWQVVSASEIDSAYQTQSYDVGAGTLIPLSSLPGSLSGLVIVQGEPSQDPMSFLLDSNRNSNLRAVGYSLAAQGAPGVLVLPSMPHAWIVPVLRAVVKTLQGGHLPDERRLLKTAAAARRAILRQPLPSLNMKTVDGEIFVEKAYEEDASWADQLQNQKLLAMQVCLIVRKNQPVEDEKPATVKKA